MEEKTLLVHFTQRTKSHGVLRNSSRPRRGIGRADQFVIKSVFHLCSSVAKKWVFILVLLTGHIARAETLNEIFLETAESGEISAVQRALEIGADLNVQRSSTGWTAL